MISFTELYAEGADELTDVCSRDIASADADEISEIIASFCELIDENPDTGVGISTFSGCLLVRIFDMGRYSFVFPISLTDESDPYAACDRIRAYSIKEEIPLVFTDVPAEALGELVAMFRHVDASAEDRERSSYRVSVKSECDFLDDVPTLEARGIVLDKLLPSDAKEYAALCRDTEVNKYWGYDYRADIDSPSDSYFVENAYSEFNRGTSLTFAVRCDGKFVGEAVIYAFDLSGGAECGFRIAKSMQGKGLGRKTLSALIDVAENIGLTELRATVMEENTKSVNLISSVMNEISREAGKIHYLLDI